MAMVKFRFASHNSRESCRWLIAEETLVASHGVLTSPPQDRHPSDDADRPPNPRQFSNHKFKNINIPVACVLLFGICCFGFIWDLVLSIWGLGGECYFPPIIAGAGFEPATLEGIG